MRDDKEPRTSSAPVATTRWVPSDLVLLGGISLIGAVLRLFWIEQWSFGVVESEAFRAITQSTEAWAQGFPQADHSRYPLFYMLVQWLLGIGVLPWPTEGWVRLPFALAGCLLPALVAVLGRPLFGRKIACFAAAVVALHPAHIAASQTANPVVASVTMAVIAGILAIHGWRWAGLIFLVLAGGCHASGWLAGLGMFCIAAAHQNRLIALPRLVWWMLLAAVVVVLPGLFETLGVPFTLVAALAFLIRPTPEGGQRAVGLALGALLPLVGGGIWWWLDPSSAVTTSIAAFPAIALLVSWAIMGLFDLVLAQAPKKIRLMRLLAVGPAIMLLGQMVTDASQYYFLYAGGRAPWRDVRNAAVSSWQSGHKPDIVAGRGCDVLRVYLRPSHWRQPGQDAHPGIRVEELPADLEAARKLLARSDVMLVLQHDEWHALLAADGGGQLAKEFVMAKVWACPQPFGDKSLYLLQRRRAD